MTKEINRADIAHKEVLTRAEAAVYLGISLDYINRLCSQRRIPFYKPLGKVSFFKRAELDEWATSNNGRVKTVYDILNEVAKK